MAISREKLESVIETLHRKLRNERYALRGTASLVLQDLDMNVDDVDILCNKESALNANSRLSEYLMERVVFKESLKFKSYFGKFLIDGVDVEVMGDWQIFNEKKGWSKIYYPTAETTTHIRLKDLEIPVTKVELELEVFALMGRWMAYQKIKRQLTPNNIIQQGFLFN